MLILLLIHHCHCQITIAKYIYIHTMYSRLFPWSLILFLFALENNGGCYIFCSNNKSCVTGVMLRPISQRRWTPSAHHSMIISPLQLYGCLYIMLFYLKHFSDNNTLVSDIYKQSNRSHIHNLKILSPTVKYT